LDTPRKLLDASIALCALVATAPILVVAALGIAWSSPGPILYRARRIARDRRGMVGGGHGQVDSRQPDRRRPIGYHGREFTLYKLRTMHVDNTGAGTPITAWNDTRVFRFGAWLRATKIDELPQLINVIRGEMALVGPRPEAPEIVRHHYRGGDLETLQVPPGLTSPGSLYYYTHCEASLGEVDVTQRYVEQVLPLKLGIDRVYISNASCLYDLRIIMRTVGVIAARLVGRQQFPDPPEMAKLAERGSRESVRSE
jgi:lipopolysaccharide/colanic/teichoic acid biosynthesis glycosyltransferase